MAFICVFLTLSLCAEIDVVGSLDSLRLQTLPASACLIRSLRMSTYDLGYMRTLPFLYKRMADLISHTVINGPTDRTKLLTADCV